VSGPLQVRIEPCLEASELHTIQDVSAGWVLATRLSAWREPLCAALGASEAAGNPLAHYTVAA
jgi:hypothetical protein